jgi:hypothetical protein
VWAVAAVILVGVGAWATVVGAAPAPEDLRYRELRRVINRNVGYAHLTRGTNMYTVIALRECVSDADVPVLARMLLDRDHVVQLTVARVLTDLGPPGVDALRRARARAQDPRARGVIDDALWYRGQPEHQPLRDHPLSPAERQRIRGCAPRP